MNFIVGTLLVAVLPSLILPPFLLWLHFSNGEIEGHFHYWDLYSTFVHFGPGALLLGAITAHSLEKALDASRTEVGFIRLGFVHGAVYGFANLPAFFYLTYILFGQNESPWPTFGGKILPLLAVTGGLSGVWIARRVWNERHASADKSFNFGLGTLLLFVILIAALMMSFRPPIR